MRLWIILIITKLLLSSAGCERKTAGGNRIADSMQLSRTGGIAGFNDHYKIADGKVLKDTNTRDGIDVYDYPLPVDKYDKVKHLLSSVPSKMKEENGRTYGVMVYDGIDYEVSARYGDKDYHWTIRHDPPGYVQPFAQQLQEAFNDLK